MKDTQIKTNIEVGGAILTEAAIKRLKDFQEDDNEHIRVIKEKIADAVCFIGRSFDNVSDSDFRAVKELLTDLSYIRDYFDDLCKP